MPLQAGRVGARTPACAGRHAPATPAIIIGDVVERPTVMMSEPGETTEAPKAASTEDEPAQSDVVQQPTLVEDGEVAYHLHLDAREARLATRALHLLITGEAHEPLIRRIAREVLAELQREPTGDRPLVVALSPHGMKITHTAVKLLLDDLRRDQADDRRTLRQILDKLPDEHAIRAIALE